MKTKFSHKNGEAWTYPMIMLGHITSPLWLEMGCFRSSGAYPQISYPVILHISLSEEISI